MGRKVKLEVQDPIIKKNPKLEKRKKNRAIVKKKQEEERQKQRKTASEYNQIKQDIVREEQQKLNRLINYGRQTHDFLQSIGVKVEAVTSRVIHSKNSLPQLSLSPAPVLTAKEVYIRHFQGLEDTLLERVQRMAKLNEDEIVKNQLRELFGKEPIQQHRLTLEGTSQWKLDQVKKLTTKEFKIQNVDYIVSDLAMANISSVPRQTHAYQSFIESYKDVIYIQNQQESTIDDFRKAFANHAISHIRHSCQQSDTKGFTNCRVVVLTPFMGDARTIVDIIQETLGFKGINHEKLEEIDDQMDMFRISIKFDFKRKTSKFFTKFDKADFIIASPLGLRLITGAEGQEKRDFSFLSSVELLYIDRAQVIMMQNWLHLVEILRSLNRIPNYQSLTNDIQTIRKLFLEEKGRFYRQNIVFSEYMFPQLNSLLKKHFENWEGYVQNLHYYPQISFPFKFQQQFFRITDCSYEQDLDVRLDYFKRKIWPRIGNNQLQQRFLILTSNPFQFVKVKSFLQKVNADADFISEHTQKNKTQSRIARFNNKQFRILLLSERAYYFQVCQISKVQNILFYSVPRNTWIYQNLINSLINPKTKEMGASMSNTVLGMYSKFQGHSLERIVGTTRTLDLVCKEARYDSFIF